MSAVEEVFVEFRGYKPRYSEAKAIAEIISQSFGNRKLVLGIDFEKSKVYRYETGNYELYRLTEEWLRNPELGIVGFLDRLVEWFNLTLVVHFDAYKRFLFGFR